MQTSKKKKSKSKQTKPAENTEVQSPAQIPQETLPKPAEPLPVDLETKPQQAVQPQSLDVPPPEDRKSPALPVEDKHETPIKEKEVSVKQSEKANDHKQERILMKSFIFSMITVIFFVIIAKFALELLGDYLPIIALSVLTSIALRPSKESISKKFKEYFGMIQEIGTHGSYLQRSAFVSFYSSVRDVVRSRKDINIYKEKFNELVAVYKNFNPTENFYTIPLVYGLYILFTRFGISTAFYLYIFYMIIDGIIRLQLDAFVLLTNKVPFIKHIKNKIQSSKNVQETIDGYVATFVIAAFLLFSVMCVVLLIVMLFMDLETILTNLHGSAATAIHTVNELASTKLGIENVIDENFAVNFLKNYNESIYSYIPNDDLKELYVSLSGTLHNFTVGNTTSSSFSDLTNFVQGLVSKQQMSTQSEEVIECLAKNRINFDFEFLRYLEEIYCTGLSYMNKFSIDPYEILDKAKEAFGFIFQVFFGTILTQLFLISQAAIDYVLNFIFFCVTVHFLLETKESLIHNVTKLLPLDSATQGEIEEFAEKSIKGSFLCTIKLFVYHFAFTWLYFDIMGLELGFIISITAAFSSLIPVIPPYALCIPHALYIYFARGQWIVAILFPIIYMLVTDKICEHIYENTIDIHPYVTGLSVMMGISAFDLQGIIYGPLLVCMIVIVYNVVKKRDADIPDIIKRHAIDPIVRHLAPQKDEKEVNAES